MRLYISGGALLLLALVYLPVVVLALRLLWRRLPPRRSIRIGVSVLAAIAAAAIPLWDVAISSVQMAQLCPSAGLRIHRTVTVDGYLADFGYGEEALAQGFSYLEKQVGPTKLTIYTKVGGKVRERHIDLRKESYSPKSRYEYRYGSPEALAQYRNIAMSRSVVIDRVSGEELGRAVSYSAFPGWLDRNTIQLLGHHVWQCPDRSSIHVEVLLRTLRPRK